MGLRTAIGQHILRRMSALAEIASCPDADAADAADAAERHRRLLLAEADLLLGRVEDLRLAELPVVPPALAAAVRSLQVRLGHVEAAHPRTVRAAQHLVFAVQARLMATNPRNRQPRRHSGRAGGEPRVTRLRRGAMWKVLTLPAPPPAFGAGAEAEWRQHVTLTVQRALDRWTSAQGQAVAAARAGEGALAAVRRASAAWANYWDLRCEAQALLSRPSSAPAASAARPP
jgi:hypothetical protein